MGNGSVIKKLEIRTNDTCPTCHHAINDLVPLAKKENIPVSITKPLETDEFIPIVCFIENTKKTCFEGYSDDIKDMFHLFVDS
ncbi:MAG: hypothetical protein KGY67_00430 [Candidatus Thermoplasmatota archaeon]|nr:hypothetical protein [Candidatus Thermoplasmatota archaeon]